MAKRDGADHVLERRGFAVKVWIIWNGDMTEGIVTRDPEVAADITAGFTRDGLAEAFTDLYGDEVLTIDEVDLGMRQ